MALDITVVDAFTDQAFAGNPAAVTVIDAFPEDARMQAVANEMSLAETAFVVPRDDNDHDLRWFTPSMEVDLCGHATLAAAHLLGGKARFHTRSGILTCARADNGVIEIDFPADVPVEVEPPRSLDLPGICWYGLGKFDALVVIDDAAPLRGLRPDLAKLAQLGTRCVIVTAPGDRPAVDCVSRVFAPNASLPEDPVTGSAHCTLACYWGERLGRDVLVGEQASARGGIIRMRRAGDRVVLGGQAVTVAHVRLLA
jgi:predicted PhzF superfamily epimerase YddE/YHI9